MDRSKKRRWLHVPSPAMLVACIALFVALGGTSYAAIKLPANSVGTKQIKKSAVTAAKVKNATLTGAKVKDATLTGAKLANSTVDAAKVGAIPGARVRRTTPLSTTSGVTAVVSYDTSDFNVGGVYDSAHPSRMTAPIAGRYLIIASARWASDVNGRRSLALELNYGTPTPVQIARSNVTADTWGATAFNPEQTVETVYKLKAGDYVEVWAYQDSTSALDLMTNVDNGVTYSMEWIAP